MIQSCGRIRRHFTKHNQDPYADIEFTHSSIDLVGGGEGSMRVNVEHPKSWSELAVSIVARKYFRKTGVPVKLVKVHEEGVPEWLQRSEPAPRTKYQSETSIKQVVDRLAGAWTYWGWRGNYFDTEEDARAFYDEVRRIIIMQACAPNSPQWFNTGLHWAYGIRGTATGMQFYVDPQTNETCEATSGYERPQPHACFIISVKDQLIGKDSIQDLWHKEATMFKFGSGVGSNFSDIRATGEPLSGGGYSSGLPSFLKVGDASAGAIKSGGTTRRAAKMVILDVDHPDIEWFVGWKTREEEKVASLVAGSQAIARHTKNIVSAFQSKQTTVNNQELERRIAIAKSDGMTQNQVDRIVSLLSQGLTVPTPETLDCNWEGEAYRTVSGQNSNNSVRITDSFMKLVVADRDFDLIRRTDGSTVKTVRASNLWNQINYNAWASADPGLQFHDTANAWHTCPQSGPIRASNPCSEYMFLDDTACNLASLNAAKFVVDGKFDCDSFEQATMLFTMVLEISVHMASFPSESIARRSYDFRTLGLGHANVGGLLMQMGVGYDSDLGRSIFGAITGFMTGVAYRTSALLAAKLGPFAEFKQNRQDMLRVVRNHARASGARNDQYEQLNICPARLVVPDHPGYTELGERCHEAWQDAERLGTQHGFRNAQVSVIAPTGTIALVMDCDTTGCEPDFALVKYKKLVGGDFVKIVNRSVSKGLVQLGYTAEQVAAVEQYMLGNKNLDNVGAPINATTLRKIGIPQTTINKLQEALASSTDLRAIITDKNLSAKELRIVKSEFTESDFDASNLYYYGAETVEGAPYIKDAHLSVFDCANQCGYMGTRSLSWEAHIKVLAALQPLVSGSISKTINCDGSVTVEDYKRCSMMAWQLGLKAIAFYRDGSKLSQPLSAGNKRSAAAVDTDTIKSIAELVVHNLALNAGKLSKSELQKAVLSKLGKPQRKSLPARRKGYTQKVHIRGHKILLRTGEYADGTLGEIFIDTHKEGATFRSLMNGFAMLFSLALQYGVPLEELVDAFYGTKFDPAGIVLGHHSIKFAHSIFSYIVDDLARHYLNKVTDGQPTTSVDDTQATATVIETKPEGTIGKYKTGSFCTRCNSGAMIRTGTCETCQDCGENNGCS